MSGAEVVAEPAPSAPPRNDGDLYPTQAIAEEVRAAVARLPLPPGYSVAHLHWSSTELPRLFGLASTRGGATPGKDVEGGGGGGPQAPWPTGVFAALRPGHRLSSAFFVSGILFDAPLDNPARRNLKFRRTYPQ